MSNIVNMNQRVRFTLSATGKQLLPTPLLGNGFKTFTPDGQDTYIATLYDVITIFGRQMQFRTDKAVTKPKSDCVFLNESIEILPPVAGHDPVIFRDGP